MAWRVPLRLRSMMVLVALIAVLLGLGRASPMVGAGVAFLLVPPITATLIASDRAEMGGTPLSTDERLDRFASSLVLNLLVAAALAAVGFVSLMIVVGLGQLLGLAEFR